MYLFSFKKFAGSDRVFHSKFPCGNPGDLIETPDDVLLNLGDTIAFSELYTFSYGELPMKVLYAKFFDAHFLSFLHRMVYQWYTTYKSVMRYFVSMEIEELLKRERKAKAATVAFPDAPTLQGDLDTEGQNLFIFPDNWTRYTTLPEEWLQHPSLINLVSTDTQNRKDLHRWQIKKSMKGSIVATHSEVFQPYRHLKKIFLIDPHKWYYHNQQDPRYSLVSVVQRMGEEYGAEVKKISTFSLEIPSQILI